MLKSGLEMPSNRKVSLMKRFVFALVCFFGLVMSAQATGRQLIVVQQPVRQAIVVRPVRQAVVVRQVVRPQTVIIRNGLFGLRQTVIVR